MEYETYKNFYIFYNKKSKKYSTLYAYELKALLVNLFGVLLAGDGRHIFDDELTAKRYIDECYRMWNESTYLSDEIKKL